MAPGEGNFSDDSYQWQPEFDRTVAATPSAAEWEGWGTALKPAHEPLVLARKPMIGTVAANVLKHGVGAINIDGCRVAHTTVAGGNLALNPHLRKSINGGNGGKIFPTEAERRVVTPNQTGRWPANVIHDGSEEVVSAFPESGPGPGNIHTAKENGGGVFGGCRMGVENIFKDSGNASRFFYTAKADKDDRLSSKHPTVKPVDLMAYLCRLITPSKGTVLDPFAGSGSTGMACLREGFDCILIEREAEYVADIERRVAHVSGADAPLFAGAK